MLGELAIHEAMNCQFWKSLELPIGSNDGLVVGNLGNLGFLRAAGDETCHNHIAFSHNIQHILTRVGEGGTRFGNSLLHLGDTVRISRPIVQDEVGSIEFVGGFAYSIQVGIAPDFSVNTAQNLFIAFQAAVLTGKRGFEPGCKARE